MVRLAGCLRQVAVPKTIGSCHHLTKQCNRKLTQAVGLDGRVQADAGGRHAIVFWAAALVKHLGKHADLILHQAGALAGGGHLQMDQIKRSLVLRQGLGGEGSVVVHADTLTRPGDTQTGAVAHHHSVGTERLEADDLCMAR